MFMSPASRAGWSSGGRSRASRRYWAGERSVMCDMWVPWTTRSPAPTVDGAPDTARRAGSRRQLAQREHVHVAVRHPGEDGHAPAAVWAGRSRDPARHLEPLLVEAERLAHWPNVGCPPPRRRGHGVVEPGVGQGRLGHDRVPRADATRAAVPADPSSGVHASCRTSMSASRAAHSATRSKGRPHPSTPMWTLNEATRSTGRSAAADCLRETGSGPRTGQWRPRVSAAARSSSRKSGWAISARARARSWTGRARQVGGAVFRDDHAGVVAGRRHDRPLRQEGNDARAGDPVRHRRRAQADERVVVEAHLGAGHEVLVATDPRDLPAVDVVRHHLAVEVDAERAVDRDEGVVLGDDGRVVDHLDRHEGHVRVPVEPGVELGGPEGEGGDRDPVEQTFGVVGDLAGLVEPHESVGEHLRVDPVAAAGTLGRAWWPPCSARRRSRSGGWRRR